MADVNVTEILGWAVVWEERGAKCRKLFESEALALNWAARSLPPLPGEIVALSVCRSPPPDKDRIAASGESATHRHKKRGSEYVLVGFGRMQSEFWLQLNPSATWDGRSLILVTDGTRAEGVDMREVAIYRSVDDGSLWVRPKEEFEDGRFEELKP